MMQSLAYSSQILASRDSSPYAWVVFAPERHRRISFKRYLVKPHWLQSLPWQDTIEAPVTSPESVKFQAGPFENDRLQQHYNATIAPDLLVMTYDHRGVPEHLSQKNVLRTWDGSSPYHKNRPTRPQRGNKTILPIPEARNHRNIPKLEKIIVHAFVKEATLKKDVLPSAAMAIQSITGQKPKILNAKTGVSPWKLRVGMPIAVQVELKGPQMYRFLTTLVEVVWPRMRDFNGISRRSGDQTGNIAFGFADSALTLFPEIESTFDQYPRMHGFDVICQTNTHSDNEARTLLAALGVPFTGKEPKKTT
ncbi:ribosomal protein L5 [Saitoella complicata NRRL Y-17804]|uniref:ribosomal protein L5 n=1 Tax=Saitoella complicata (strain BCRC 22490 / CBS 7301 / JCM 7358 / NBRC 10748 / NRRL Y-17804) TaxID=698492 RepID=UPI0008670F94|nr:ribosomal protein L5 [Saitoella complicata NRRL Y-17804]ODQ52483.1 ribosomal protein L5 [Saitoella complicata NRRL Y-17804]